VIAALWKNDLRHYLIALNIVVFAVLLVYLLVALLSPKRAQAEGERTPANQTPFYADDDLEGRRLERVQGWALIFAAVVAVALPIYWLREPTRQDQSEKYFDKNAVHRGAVLFAQPGTEEYEAATSKQCAACHGDEGQGGAAPFRINGVAVKWKAPPLNTELLRFTPEEVTQIITYGRPGTPMQGWGVAGGGPLNDQGVQDLVAFINSIQISPQESQAQAAEALKQARADSGTCPEFVSCPGIAVKDARSTLAADQKALDKAADAAKKTLKLPAETPDADLTARCDEVLAQIKNGKTLNVAEPLKTQGVDCDAYKAAAKTVSDDEAALAWTLEWQSRRANISDGQIMFEYACARCHTEGWSVFDPTHPPSAVDGITILGLSGGGGGQGGGTGFNLRAGSEIRRFGNDESDGFAKQAEFVGQGSEANKEYGILGIGTGRMPGFASMLSQDDINKIVSYERYCLDVTVYTAVSPLCETKTTPRTMPTSTTTTTAAGGG
jgi:mono/diheme cytochrome c family protein